MFKAKLMAVFAGMIAILAISAAPALAEFQSNSSETKGVSKSGEIVLEGGGATLECTSTEGEWTILSGGVPATKGTVLSWNVQKWSGCKVKSKEIKELIPNKISSCTLHFTQAAGETEAKGSVVTECWISVMVGGLTCTIHVAIAGNGFLASISVTNSGGNLIITITIVGMTTTIKGACLGITATKAAKMKTTVTGVGVKEV